MEEILIFKGEGYLGVKLCSKGRCFMFSKFVLLVHWGRKDSCGILFYI